MSIRTRFSIAAAGLVTAAVGGVALGAATGASNQAFVMFETLRECGDRYQAAKVSDSLNQQSWGEFFNVRHASLVAPTKVAAPASAAAPSAPASTQAIAPPVATPRLPAMTVKTATVAEDRTAAPDPVSRGWKPRQTEGKAQMPQIRKNDPRSATWVKYRGPSDKRSTPE
jgi:hypothetical protein